MAFLQNVYNEEQRQTVTHNQTDVSEFVEHGDSFEFISDQQYPTSGTVLMRYCLDAQLWSMEADGHGGSRKLLIEFNSDVCRTSDVEDAVIVNRKTKNTQDYSGVIMNIVFTLLLFMLFVIFIVPKLFN